MGFRVVGGKGFGKTGDLGMVNYTTNFVFSDATKLIL